MKRADLDLYTHYLLSTFDAATATGLSVMVDGDVSHDQITRFRRKPEPIMREMIDTCIHNSLRFRFVLMDSWFSSEENFEFITGKGRHFMAALKDNRLIALSEEDRKKKRFTRVDELANGGK